MSSIVKISEAASMALHATVILASDPANAVAVTDVATAIRGSEAHLSKVMQRLVRSGIVRSTRGPKGGYLLARPAAEIFLLEVYETIEGPLNDATCLLDPPICDGQCLLGGLLHALNGEARRFLAQSTVADLAGTVLSMLTVGDQPATRHA